MEVYKTWVRRNRDYIHSLDSLANGLTWLLPERFADSEIGPEAVSAVLGLITILNDHIIDTAPSQKLVSSVEPSSTPWSLWISIIKDLETLVEVAAEQLYGDDKKWDFIAIAEAAKVLVRLALSPDSRYKMLLQGGETLNVPKDSKALDSQRRIGGFTKPGYLHDHSRHNPQNLEGRALSALNRFGENRRLVSDPTWLSRLQHHQAIRVEPPASVVERPTLSTIWSEKGLYGSLFVMAEVLHITRPLIYVLFITKYGVRSWKPWILSLAVDLSGMGMLSFVTRSGHCRNDGHFTLSTSEKNEAKT